MKSIRNKFILSALIPFCGAFAEERPNIVFLITEDLSPVFGCYGGEAITPNIDRLAKEGIVYNRAYSMAPISAPTRSCLMTGVYSTSTGTQHLRQDGTIPSWMKTLPECLRAEGYFTSNRNKTDYNFSSDGRWSVHNSSLAPWRERAKDEPFYSFINIGSTHEGSGNSDANYAKATKDLPIASKCDPKRVNLPPYYPNTPEMRRIQAHYIDLASALDIEIGKVLDSLRTDGLTENTIIIVASDHGTGLPRYKRWLNVTGLQVPFIVYIPEKFKDPSEYKTGKKTDEIISYVDFAPTVLSLAGIEQPTYMQGQPFLGKYRKTARKYAFAARSRADDMYEISRAVIGERYIYIRHYLPFHPYIPTSTIFSDEKLSLKELRRIHELPEAERISLFNAPEDQKRLAQSEIMWNAKPNEELYDLANDPHELSNLADSPEYKEIKDELHSVLREHILNTRDAGFLMEPEMMERGKKSTVYEMAQNPDSYVLRPILNAAEQVGFASEADFLELTYHKDSGVRFWGVMGLRNLADPSDKATKRLKELLADKSPSVQIGAAELLCLKKADTDALSVLGYYLKDERLWVKLYAARSIEQTGERAASLIPQMKEEIDRLTSEKRDGVRRYKDFNLSSFTGWTLENALLKNNIVY
ncbi:MAG: sulfatase-like hydrolase/transferase [Bacteroidales bacterium]|nr:sulfatase-like hydrolase/transferase [Bacteroidales bacterium]